MQKVHDNAPIMMMGKEGANGKGKWKGKKKIGSKNLGPSMPAFKKASKPKGVLLLLLLLLISLTREIVTCARRKVIGRGTVHLTWKV